MLRLYRAALVELVAVFGLTMCGCSGGGAPGNGAFDGGSGAAGQLLKGGQGGLGAQGGQGAQAGHGAQGGSAGTDAGASDGTAGASSDPCAAYITCVAEATPAGLDAVLAAYGQSGSCWAEGNASLCDKACWAGLISTHQAFPSVEACNVCASTADCPSAEPACDVAAGRCVSCLLDSDCKSATAPACDGATHTCVTCTSDIHCTGQSEPHCSSEHECVECASNFDCAQSFNGPICDGGTHHCRGCTADSECGSGACVGSMCVECKVDSQCPSAKPHCASNGICTQCTSNSECGKGVCAFGGCCGVTACADQGAQCGSVLDISNPLCLFSPIACGSCSSGNTCVFNKCKPTPVNTCVPTSCPSGKCGYVPEQNAYACISAYSSCTKANPTCSAGYDCVSKKSSTTGDYYYTCERYCLSDNECTNATHCALIYGPGSLGRCE